MIPAIGFAMGEPHLPVPFTADFDVDFGPAHGVMELELKPAETAGTFEYSSHTRARGIARMFYKGEANGSTRFRIVDGVIQPLLFQLVDKKGRTQERIIFDWKNGIADSQFENTPAEIDIEPGILDALTIDLTATHQLNLSATLETASYVAGNKIKTYEYTFIDKREVDTKAGTFECVMYKRQRTGSRRSYNICYAPGLSHLPVLMEQYKFNRKSKKDELKARMTLRSIDCESCVAVSPDGESE
jgi:hypothetical protein